MLRLIGIVLVGATIALAAHYHPSFERFSPLAFVLCTLAFIGMMAYGRAEHWLGRRLPNGMPIPVSSLPPGARYRVASVDTNQMPAIYLTVLDYTSSPEAWDVRLIKATNEAILNCDLTRLMRNEVAAAEVLLHSSGGIKLRLEYKPPRKGGLDTGT